MKWIACEDWYYLRDGLTLFTAYPDLDSAIDSSDMRKLVSLFFDGIDVAVEVTDGEIIFWDDILDYLRDNVSELAELYKRYEFVATRNWAVIKGYYILVFDVADRCDIHERPIDIKSITLVISACDNRFIGSISAALGGVNSDKLARLIMATPEIDWSF